MTLKVKSDILAAFTGDAAHQTSGRDCEEGVAPGSSNPLDCHIPIERTELSYRHEHLYPAPSDAPAGHHKRADRVSG